MREGIYIPETTDSGLYTGFIVYHTGMGYQISVFTSCTWGFVVDRAEALNERDDIPVVRCNSVLRVVRGRVE